uniref:Uncharacterized protein n=1 Tax=Arundo donax TaxID=35708 RepID=A0A0A8YQ83_ARUDO
MGRRPALSIP